MDRFTKVCLVVIVVLLAIIALRPILAPESARAANGRKYSLEQVFSDQSPITEEDTLRSRFQSALNKIAADGRRLVQVVPADQECKSYYLIVE